MESELTAPSIALHAEPVLSAIRVSRALRTTICFLVGDSIAALLALMSAVVLRSLFISGPAVVVTDTVVPAILLTICSLIASGLYPGVCENPVEELRRCTLAITLAYTTLGASTFFLHDMSQSRTVFLFSWLFCLFLIPIGRSVVRTVFSRTSWWGVPVIILGAGKTGKSMLNTLMTNRRIGLRPVAILDDNPETLDASTEGLMSGPLTRCLEICRSHRISYGIVCMPSLSRKQLFNLLDRYGHCFGHIMVIPDLIGMASLGVSVREVGGVIGLEVTQKLLRPTARIAKRALDLTITLCLMPFLVGLVALVALLIKMESPGPVLFANERIGYAGRRFKAWKLRSMHVNGDEILRAHLDKHPEDRPEWEATQKLKKDPRVTRIGKIIRKASIDELPQLWNVLIGEMSLVGPRPMLEAQVPLYGAAYASYKRVKPGITGLWQISGRNHLTFSERARLDNYTIQNWSVWLDIYILARTVFVVLTAHGAY